MKRLSFRFVRRLMLLLALVFPVVYLMGGFVAALAGSHGNVTLAQDDEVVTSSNVVDFNQLVRNGAPNGTDYWVNVNSNVTFDSNVGCINLTIGASSSTAKGTYNDGFIFSKETLGHKFYYHGDFISSTGSVSFGPVYYSSGFNVSTSSFTSVSFVSTLSNFSPSLPYFFIYYGAPLEENALIYFRNVWVVDLTQMYGAGNEPTAEVFGSRYNADYYDYTLSTKLVEETTAIPTYSEYLFNQILGSDNIIKQWGYYALSDEEKGFAPFASLIQIVDDNFFHLGDSNDLGLFVYGYVYYALNIVAIYELVALVVMVFTIPLKLTDRFTKEM